MALSFRPQSDDFPDFFRARLGALSEREVFELPSSDVPRSFRRAAVLLAFWRDGNGVRLLLTERSANLRSHSGQIAFPGGRVDEADSSYQAAALRESWEEVGIASESVEVLGRLDDVWSGAHHHVAAFVGWLDSPPDLILNSDEVASAYKVDVEPLLDPSAVVATEHEYLGQPYVDFSFSGEWGRMDGMSADLLLELLQFVRGEPTARGKVRLEELKRYVGSHPELLEE